MFGLSRRRLRSYAVVTLFLIIFGLARRHDNHTSGMQLQSRRRPMPTKRGFPTFSGDSKALPGILALYFPQFHEFEVNNALWGKGYTDFTGLRNVTKSSKSSAVPGYPVIRPSDGFFDLDAKWIRARHARAARAAGIHGFVYYHYWFDGGPVMEKPLEMMLVDGEPNLPFAISWANENWSKRWDGGDNAVLMKQTYNRRDWRPHFDWLARFFAHPSYVRRHGKPVLFLYRAHDVTGLDNMLTQWRQWAVEAGLGGLYVVQTNGVKWTPSAYKKAGAVDGIMEFYPNFYGHHPSRDMAHVVDTNPADFNVNLEDYMFGAHVGWNNRPRHLSDGLESVIPYHPINLRAELRQQLRRSHPDSFVVINAWNEWGEGAAMEPSIEHGDTWLRAIEGAIKDASTWTREVQVPPAGVGSLGASESDNVCIVVRTYGGHDDGHLFGLRKTLSTLLNLVHVHWEAFIVDTGDEAFTNMDDIVSSLGDNRLHVVTLPDEYKTKYESLTSAYDATDYIGKKHCTRSGRFTWYLVTNGDNFYAPDALNYLPPDKDAVFMNFYSRYTLVNAVISTQGDMSHCCTRLANGHCHAASPKIGHIDLGAMVMRVSSWTASKLSFSKFHGACGSNSCHDGALAEHVDAKLQWSIGYHDHRVCAFLHNPNPAACKLVGGIYYDTDDWNMAGCFDPSILHTTSDLRLPTSDVDWVKYMASDACVCAKQK